MKKILNLLIIVVFSFLVVSCGDNNEGPFETRKENGNLVLYSNNKPAKGWVESTYTDFNSNVTYKISEIEYDKGLPTGKFKYYNRSGILFFDADLTKKGELFKGTIKSGVDQDTILEGEFNINSDWIVTRDSAVEYLDILIFANDSLYNGSIDGPNYKFNHKNGQKDGTYQVYFNNGQLKIKGRYVNGEKDGIWEEYYTNGQLGIKGEFKNNKLDGQWEKYEMDGKLNAKGNYINGEKDGIWEDYYTNGKLKEKGKYTNGKLDGEWEEYEMDGKLCAKGKYINGERDGQWEYVEEIGGRKFLNKGKYINGEKDGIWYFYNENGKLVFENTYKDGLLINEEYYGY